MASASSKKVIYAALAGNFLIALTKFIAFFCDQKLGHAVRRGPLGRGYQQSSSITLRIAPGQKARRRAISLRTRQGGLFLGVYRGDYDFYHRCRRLYLQGRTSPSAPRRHSKSTINYVVLAFALLFEGAAWYFALTEFTKAKGKWGYIEAVQRGKDPSIFVVLFEDSAALLV